MGAIVQTGRVLALSLLCVCYGSSMLGRSSMLASVLGACCGDEQDGEEHDDAAMERTLAQQHGATKK